MKPEVTKETQFTGRSGQDIIIHRYGKNDYSVWLTDDPGDDTSGCSVRGTLFQILEEVAGEVPARKISSNSDRLETIGCFIDIFEDFLEEKGINIQNEEKDQDEDAAIIYGTDYGNLSDRIESLLVNLGVLNCE